MAKNPLLPIFLVVFMDLLGLTIAIPVVAPLFLDPHATIFGPSTPLAMRTILLGLLLAAYPAAQFFGAPIIGGLSDHHGRKKMLLLSIAGTLGGYLLFAAGVIAGYLPLLFLGRIIDGFTGGNISIALSAIADVSDERAKSRNFGMIGMAFGLGFIIGPFVGGKLADPSVVSWFSYSTPFLFAAALSGLNLLLISRLFEETLTARSKTPIDPFMGIRNVRRAFGMPNLRTLFLVVFLLTLGFNFFTQFFPVFLIEKFGFTQSSVGDTFAYVGFWIALTQGVLNRRISARYGADSILKYSTVLLSAALALLVIPSDAFLLMLLLTFVPVTNGFAYPNYTALISNQSGKESQGEVMGITQSIQALAQAVPPIIAGFIVSINVDLPILVSCAVTFLAWLAFVVFYKPGAKERFHEA